MNTVIENFFYPLLDLLYPLTCPGCGCEIESTSIPVCGECVHALAHIHEPVCDRCGAPLFDGDISPNTRGCKQCPEQTPCFDHARSLFIYNDDRVRNIIHALKFDYQTRLAPFLAQLFVSGYQRFYRGRDFDLIVPVPLHSSRLRSREFNQSTLMAEGLSRSSGIPFDDSVVKRIRKTKSQVSMNETERRKNLLNAFAVIRPESIHRKHILLLDDVMTTGTTVSEVSRVLREAGTASISVLTLARAIDLRKVQPHITSNNQPSFSVRPI